jgi:hypothetical protein
MPKFFAALLLSLGLLLPVAAAGADVFVVSMQYSKSRPVPHLHYQGGTASGDLEKLRTIYDTFVHCRVECATAKGLPTAVLTLYGEGGHYYEGLALAHYLRANNIATVVESDTYCYSACAFTFLGGTSYSSDPGIGQYVDRVLEPGGVLGYHAPYAQEQDLQQALQTTPASELMQDNRVALSTMVKDLVTWNVDPEIIHHMLNQGPNEFYLVEKPEAYYLTRTALPPIPSRSWISDTPAAVRNACIRLLAMLERADPAGLADRITAPFESGIGFGERNEPLSGYRLSNGLLDVGFCAASDASIANGSDLDVALYLNPLQPGGSSLAVLNFFNRDGGFSTADFGASPLKRVFQRGGLGHWFLPIGQDLAAAPLGAALAIRAEKFFSAAVPALPPLPIGFTQDVTGFGTRVSYNGDVWLFEQVGSADLFDAALAASGNGVFLTHDSVQPNAFVRDGIHSNGTYFSLTGFRGATTSFVQRAIVINDGQPLSDAQRALLTQLNCGASYEGLRLIC